MNKEFIEQLNSGIYLENAKILLPWKTRFKELITLGNPKLKEESGRKSLTWTNEKILNGLSVDIKVLHEGGLIGMNKVLNWASADIREEALKKTRLELEAVLGLSKFKNSGNEYKYLWKLKNASILLMQRDRFGFYWEVLIKHNSSLYAIWS